MIRRLALAAVFMVAAGCGATDEEQVRELIHRLGEAVANADANMVCSLMTERYRNTLAGPCEESLNYDSHPLSTGEKQALRHLQVIQITVQDDTAAATLKAGSDASRVRFRRVEGRWLLDDEGVGSGD